MKKLILFVLAVVSMAYGQTTTFIPMGGINDQTANYLVVATDVGKIVRMNCASCTVTLPSVPPYLRWSVFISNINSSALTVSPNGVLLDGSTSNLSLLQNQSVWISTDGTLYGTVRGGQSGTTSASDQSVLFSQIGTVAGDGLFTYDYINKVIGWPAPFVATTSWPGTPLSPPGAGKTTFGPDSDGTFKTCVGTNPCTAPGSASFPDGTTLAPGLPATLHPELGLAIVLSKIAYPITNVARATNVVTVTVSTPNTGLNWPVNGTISTFGLLTPYDVLNCVRCTLLSVTGGTPTSTFTYTLAGADVGSAAATGSSSIYETQLTGYSVALTRMDTTSNNPAQRGSIRLGHNDAMEARNIGNTDDMWLIGGVSGVDEVQVGGQSSGFLGTYHPGYLRMLEQAAPANPAASNAKLYVDSTSHNLTCLNSSGGSCLPAGGSSAFSAITGSTNTTAAMVVGTGASLATSGSGTIAATSVPWSGVTASTNTVANVIGAPGSLVPSTTGNPQIASNQFWAVQQLAPPTITAANSGGTIGSGQVIQESYTLTSALGESTPSATLSGNPPAPCVSGVCTITITAPTIPSGYTSWTAYFTDAAAGGATTPQKVVACTNLVAGVNCTITNAALNSGVSQPTIDASIVQPSGIQADVCAPGVRNAMYTQDNAGNWYVQAGNDTTNTGATPPAPYSAFTFCRRTWFNDSGVDPPGFKNSFVLINHTAGVGTNAAVQDRALGILYNNPVGDAATRWGLEGEQLELDFNGTPTINGSPDGEVSAVSVQLAYNATANAQSTGTYGANGMRVQVFREQGAGYPAGNGARMTGIQVLASNVDTIAGGGSQMTGIYINNQDPQSAASLNNMGLEIQRPSPRFTGSNWGEWIYNYGNNASDWNFVSQSATNDPTSGREFLGGNVYLPGILATGGSINVQGSLTPQAISTIQMSGNATQNPSVAQIGAAGGTTDTYCVIFLDATGGSHNNTDCVTTNLANATLNGTNFNRITVGVSAMLQGTAKVQIYRTAAGGTPSTTGLIGTQTVQITPNPLAANQYGAQFTFDDTGIAGDLTAVPGANTTGGIKAAGYVFGTLNRKFVAGDFTTANNTSLQTITGLAWNTPATAANYSFHCSLIYSQATANAAVAFGIQAATVAPTAINAMAQEGTSLTAFTTGTLRALASTTATNIVSATPSAFGAVGTAADMFNTYLDGTIELPAGGNTVNIMVSTATGADAVTVYRGSYCNLF